MDEIDDSSVTSEIAPRLRYNLSKSIPRHAFVVWTQTNQSDHIHSYWSCIFHEYSSDESWKDVQISHGSYYYKISLWTILHQSTFYGNPMTTCQQVWHQKKCHYKPNVIANSLSTISSPSSRNSSQINTFGKSFSWRVWFNLTSYHEEMGMKICWYWCTANDSFMIRVYKNVLVFCTPDDSISFPV